jgi:hypothetical protein
MDLILPNTIDEATFQARFPLPYCTRALTPWEARRVGLDWTVQQWIFTAPFIYNSDRFGPINIPTGFTTDAASVPPRLQSVIGRTDPRILGPSAPHDWLFTRNGLTDQPLDQETMDLLADQGLLEAQQTCRRLTFEQTNELLVEAMWYCGADEEIRAAVYEAVQIGGKATWNAHNPPAAYRA